MIVKKSILKGGMGIESEKNYVNKLEVKKVRK